MARVTLDQIKTARPKVDRGKIEKTSEKDIARHMRQDGEDPKAELSPFVEDLPPAVIRKRLAMG